MFFCGLVLRIKIQKRWTSLTDYVDFCSVLHGLQIAEYSPANLKFGVITRNTIGDCIISPIYVTFKIENGFLPKFVELLVTRKRFISRARKYEQGTVYERMAVNSSDLLSMYVSIPSLNTQQTIVNIINNIDNKISNEKELLKLYRAQKVYLLKNMFI